MSYSYLTSLTIYVSNTKPYAGDEVEIYGTLKYRRPNPRGGWIWAPLGGKTVYLYEDGKKILSTSTDIFSGDYKFKIKAKQGPHTYYTYYPGE